MKEKIIKTLESESYTAWDVNEHLVYVIYDGDIPDVASKIESLINQEVERRIKERMPSEEEIEKNFTTPHYHYEKGHYYKVRKDRIFGAKWYRSRLTPQVTPQDTPQEKNTEGGGE